MATISYAEKYSKVVDEKFASESKSALVVNRDYDFVGAKTVKVYTISTSSMNNYGRDQTGTSRYGEVGNLDATAQELTMTRDRSFTFAIDKMDSDETGGALMAGTALARQLREAAIPELDQYRYGKIVSEAGKTETIALTKSNVYEQILKGTEALDEASVPLVGRYIVVTPQVYSLMKQSQNFMLDSEIAQEMRLKGVVSIFDGMPVIKVPTSLLPSNVQAIIGHPVAVTSPIKLAEYKINDTPQGISGSLVEGRLYYDAFVLNNKKKALYVITSA